MFTTRRGELLKKNESEETRKRRHDVQTEKLRSALAAVSRFSSRRTPNEGYSKTYLIPRDGKLSVMAMGQDGSCAVHTEEPWSKLAIVDADVFASVVGNYNTSEITLQVGKKITAKDGTFELELPIHDLPVPSFPSPRQSEAIANTKEWMHAARCMAFTESEKEMEFAQGQRLLAKEGRLFFLSASKGGMNGISVVAGGSMDVIVPSSALVAATTAIQKGGGDTVSLTTLGGCLVIGSGDMVAQVVTVEGKRPHGRDVFDKVRAGAVEWNLPHAELLQFLKQCKQFASEFHSGVDLEATDDGLIMSFSAIGDDGEVSPTAKGTCKAVVPGKFAPGKVCIKHAPLWDIVRTAGEDMSLTVKPETGIFVTAGEYFAGYAHMRRSPCK